MQKLLLLFVCVLTSIGAWADSETTMNVGSNGSSVKYGDRWGGQLFAILNSQNENDFAEWYYSDANTGQLDNYLKVLRVTGNGAKIPLTGGNPSYPNSYIKLSGGEWEAPSIEIHIDDADSQSALSIWLNNTRNTSLFSCADMNKLTITGKNPHWNYENGSNKGVVTLQIGNDGKPYLDIEVQNGSATGIYNSFVSDNSLFSSMPGRIFINDAKTSYIDLSSTSAAVTSANENDFASWVADNPDALSSVTNYTFNGNAKFTTGGDNYVVINGQTATATCTDNSASLHTWANANGAYLNNVQTVNFSSETTIYMTDPADEAKRVVVSGNNLTVYCEDIADYNNWKNNALNSKIVNGKTVKTVGVKMKLADGCYIEFSEDGKTAYVHAQHAGCLTSLYDTYIAPSGNPNTSSFPDGTTLVFGNDCELSNEDVTKVLTGGTGQWKLYFDFFDVTNNGQMTVAAIDAAINAGVESMASSYKSQYGIILPFNSTIGTSAMIRSNGNSNGDGSTFTKYAAYYRESETAKNLTLHVWDKSYWNGWGNDAANSYAAAAAQLNTHNEVKSAETVTVSTLTNSSFDLSKLDALKVKIEITSDDMIKDMWNQSAPNTNIPARADIYVDATAPGGFAEHISTAGTKNTPTNLLQISGNITASDLLAVNSFSAGGPRILDLSKATLQGAGFTASTLSDIANSDIEYIILPPGLSKDVVCGANYSDLTNLKAAISTNSTTLVAYLNEAGSLTEARSLTTGGSTYGGLLTPTTTGLTSVTLSGNLNASDLAVSVNQTSKIGSNGHLYSGSTFNVTGMPNVVASDKGNGYEPVANASGQGTSALNGEGNIAMLDLSGAVFENQYDMNFNLLGLVNGSLQTLKLPTSQDMTILPTGALMGSSGNVIDYLCIPSNFTTIMRYALGNTTVRCLTTDNADHTVVIGANGEQYATDAEAKAACYDTFTLSSNIASVGMGAFLPQSETITDIYVMATTTPKCERDAFSSGMLFGWGGFDGAGAYCRAKYTNGGKLFTMLHFPEQGNMTDAAYEQMKKNYTDVNKIYTKKDQTGAVDGNGDPIAWPSQGEVYRTYTQASWGLTWNDWETSYGPEVNTDGKGGYGAYRYPDVTAEATGNPSHDGDYDFADYIGWHQFVLAMATYFDQPDIIVENEKTVLQYVEGGWYTLCLPFSLTEDQLIEMLGVPKSEDNTISRLVNQDGTVIEESVSSRKLPDLRTLRSVTRTPNDPTVGNKNHIRFLLTNNLTETAPGTYQYWGINDANPSQSDYAGNGSVEGTGEKIALRGGYPYLVKPYIRYGETVTNLGKYILTRFASEFESDKLSCKKRDDCFEYLNGETETSKFAKPYEKHKIQAVLDKDGSTSYEIHKDETKYYYTFVGQFWEQDLPRYAFYMVNNTTDEMNWYRYTSGNKGWKWEPYKCIIMATQQTENNTSERAHASSGLYRDDAQSTYPVSTGTDSKGAEIFEDVMEIRFLDGRDDAIFDSSNDSYANYSFIFEDMTDVAGDVVSAIINLDGQDVQALPKNVKVFNAAGQFVGTSLDGLSKGLYIVNGKKFVVK